MSRKVAGSIPYEVTEFFNLPNSSDRLCCLMVRAPSYRSRGPSFISGSTRFLRSSGPGTVSTQPHDYN
jgi:hypothetical protein